MSTDLRVFVRDHSGKTFGPFDRVGVNLFTRQQTFEDSVYISFDGVEFVEPGRAPGVRMAFPLELWGPEITPGTAEDNAWMDSMPPRLPTAIANASPGAVTVTWSSIKVLDPKPPPQSSESKHPSAVPTQGALTNGNGRRLYFLAVSMRKTGLLTFQLGDRDIFVFFRAGEPKRIDSNAAEDTLGHALVSSGTISQDTLELAEQQKHEHGGALLQALLGTGLIGIDQVLPLMVERASNLLYRGLIAETGTFSWQDIDVSAANAQHIGDKWSVYMDALRKLTEEELRRRLAPSMELAPSKSTALSRIENPKLTARELRTLQRCDGTKKLSALLQEDPKEQLTLLRTIYMVQPFEAVTFAPPKAPTASVASSPSRVAAPASSPSRVGTPIPPLHTPPGGVPVVTAGAVRAMSPPVLTPAGGVPVVQPMTTPANGVRASAVMSRPSGLTTKLSPDRSDELNRLTKVLAQMKDQDHSQVLGVPPQADAAEAKAAYMRLAKMYHPDTKEPGASEAELKVRDQIFARIGEAYRAFSDVTLRSSPSRTPFSAATASKTPFAGRPAATAAAAPSGDAVAMFKQACTMVTNRKFQEAFELLNQAIAINPNEAEWYAWRGFSRYFCTENKKLAHDDALRDISECNKRNSTLAISYYYYGYILKMSNDLVGAKNAFKRCLRFDPKHPDATRELRTMK